MELAADLGSLSLSRISILDVQLCCRDLFILFVNSVHIVEIIIQSSFGRGQ